MTKIVKIVIEGERIMPRALTEREIAAIKIDLLAIAEELLKSNSVKKITVDELTQRAKIAKGTFYRLYKNKELLFYDVFRRRHDEIQDYFIAEIKQNAARLSAEKFTEIIMNLFHQLSDSFIMDFIQRGDLEDLLRSLPESLNQEHLVRDKISMKELGFLFPHLTEDDLDLFTAAIRLALVSILHKKEIGIEHYDKALHLTLKGIITEMMEGKEND